MPYIGKNPVVGNFVKLDAIVTSATATYNLLNGGTAYYPQTANNCIVSLNGVIQSPTSAYTISGSTIVFDSALTSLDVIDFILVLGDVLAIGTPSDGTVTSAKLASGTTGLIAWQSIVTAATLTAVSGRGYWIDTTSNACTVTLPASATAGDTIILVDYARKFATNAVTINTNSLNFQGATTPNPVYNTDGQSVTLVYSGATQGWIPIVDDNVTLETPPPYSVDFLVVAGGGGGGLSNGAGGGAGGYRTSTQTVNIGTVITVTVGDGGAGSIIPNTRGVNGSNSSISGSGLTTITSAGGGAAGSGGGGEANGNNGGSGGGGGNSGGTGGSGNTPSTSPSQGNNGGSSSLSAPGYPAAGGGGAGANGSNASTNTAGAGGNGTASSITGSSVTRAGGGGGAVDSGGSGGAGGTGGGGNGGINAAGSNGTANTGGGGGGGNNTTGGAGGKGVVILSVPTANYSATSTGSPTITTSGSNTILQFTGSGTYTG